jgi:hypothetical protein
MTDVRCIWRPGYERQPRTNVVPTATTQAGRDTRNTLAQFVAANTISPLYFSEQQNEARVNEALDTMTLQERIAIEIEMQSRNANVHTVDYDPLR